MRRRIRRRRRRSEPGDPQATGGEKTIGHSHLERETPVRRGCADSLLRLQQSGAMSRVRECGRCSAWVRIHSKWISDETVGPWPFTAPTSMRLVCVKLGSHRIQQNRVIKGKSSGNHPGRVWFSLNKIAIFQLHMWNLAENMVPSI